jgi:hypothetical protein
LGSTTKGFATITGSERVNVPRKEGRTHGVALWVATTFLLLAQGLALLLFLRHGWDALTFPYPLNYGEGPLLDQTVRLAQFQNIYRTNLSAPPYVVTNYPPLFMLAQVPFVWTFGPALWYGRLVSLLSVAAVALFVGLTLHALTRDRIAAVAGGLVFPAMPFVVRWSSLSRVDSLGLALSWAGLFVVARWPQRRWSVFFSALLLVAAVYTRQTYMFAAPLAAFVWLFAQGQRRRAIQTAAILPQHGDRQLERLPLGAGKPQRPRGSPCLSPPAARLACFPPHWAAQREQRVVARRTLSDRQRPLRDARRQGRL